MELEIWISNENREEHHYFLPGGDVGYQHNTYLFGYNPRLVSETTVQEIIKLIEKQMPAKD
jgi:hypothetical protein